MKTALAAKLLVEASGHAMLYEPPARSTGGIRVGQPNCAGGSCLWFTLGTFIGCPVVTGGDRLNATLCPSPAKPTIQWMDPRLATVFPDGSPLSTQLGDWTMLHPWRFPGSAPVSNACGVNGGGACSGPSGTGGEAFFGHEQGHLGTELPPLLKQTTWIAGSEVEVAWGITANHGGGYQYRLCRVRDASGGITGEATEECFQRMPLEFVGDTQWIQFDDGSNTSQRVEIPATRVSSGVLPKGSTWTKNPVPACNDIPRLGGHNHACAGPMFQPPLPHLFGFGPGACATGVPEERCTLEQVAQRSMDFGIVDKLRVPEHLEPGDYVLGFRWDCEQLPQVWSQCADVKIGVEGSAQATRPFSPWSGCEQCCEVSQGPCANCSRCQDDRTGACQYCWQPLRGFTFGALPAYQCLGFEGPDGGPSMWKLGMPIDTRWSRGCPKCWRTPDSCTVGDRETKDEAELLV